MIFREKIIAIIASAILNVSFICLMSLFFMKPHDSCEVIPITLAFEKSETKPKAVIPTKKSSHSSGKVIAATKPKEPSGLHDANRGDLVAADESSGSEEFSSPEPIMGENHLPRYPMVARKRKHEGIVSMQVTINAEGLVKKLAINKSSGSSLLDDVSIETMKGWRFKPSCIRNVCEDSTITISFNYKLNQGIEYML